ncbi:MAG TPA: hypothetical protein DEQ24_09615 [Enterococcus sp.]|nr:hypothetical protein [Enterococcus sp.]
MIMDLTIRGEASCTQCHKHFEGKLIIHLQEDLDGTFKTVPPLETNELQEEEIAIHYQYGPVIDGIDGTFTCPNCQAENDVRIEIPAEILDAPL